MCVCVKVSIKLVNIINLMALAINGAWSFLLRVLLAVQWVFGWRYANFMFNTKRMKMNTSNRRLLCFASIYCFTTESSDEEISV